MYLIFIPFLLRRKGEGKKKKRRNTQARKKGTATPLDEGMRKILLQ